ncbi:MAG TPA: hypothetical protein VL738_06555 [Dactylosporangium sp.]|nr:hypothetical protein [Dactylosporangium sp.]
MAAPDRDHPALFERALRTPDADRWPFDLARIRLAYGERLRRTRMPSQARAHLEAAADAFEQLGARPWATRAENELRATGVHRERSAERAAGLTAQQRQIAQLATVAEIPASHSLYVSQPQAVADLIKQAAAAVG